MPMKCDHCGLERKTPANCIRVVCPACAQSTHGCARTACRPDFQGVGIGNTLAEFVCGMFIATGNKITSTTSSPAMIHHRDRSPVWKRTRKHGFVAIPSKSDWQLRQKLTHSETRMTSSFEFCGEPRPREAGWFGILKGEPSAGKSRTRIRRRRS
jgi:hypothetical protein